MKKILIVFIMLLSGLGLAAMDARGEASIPGRTNHLVNDYAGALSPETKTYLEKMLRDIRGSDFTGTEIVVSTFETLDGLPFERFMQEYAGKWRRPALLENDNRMHIVLIVGEKKIRIGVGRYVQHIITAGITRNVIDNIISPELSNGNYNDGIKKGVEAIIGLLKEGGLPKSYAFLYIRRLFGITILLIFAGVILFSFRRKF